MNNKGLTLVELIIAMAVSSILLVASYQMLSVGVTSHETVLNEFDRQAAIRHSIESINSSLRYASVSFVVTEDDFQPAVNGNDIDGLVKPWHYIGLSPDKQSLVHYQWIDDGSVDGRYTMKTLAESTDGFHYDIEFRKVTETGEDNLLKYILKGYNNTREVFSVNTELEALNALQVIDWGDVSNKSVALAYRTDETPEIDERPVASIGMIMDKSGSMDYAMDTSQSETDVYGSNPKRIELLKYTLTKDDGGIFSILEDSDSYVSLIPFSSNGDNYTDFYKVNDERDDLEDEVNDLIPGGATNTGDGIRQGFFRLKYFNEHLGNYSIASDKTIKNYLIILVDGETTAASVESLIHNNKAVIVRSDPEYLLEDRRVNTDTFYQLSNNYTTYSQYTDRYLPTGAGNQLDTFIGTPYVTAVGNLISSSTDITIDKSFVIGYSDDSGNLENIVSALSIPYTEDDLDEDWINNEFVYVATDSEGLADAFASIGDYINEDLWQVSGPRLNP